MLRAGLQEAGTSVEVRRIVVIAAILIGLTTYDEYCPLVARDHEVITSVVPLLIAIDGHRAAHRHRAGRTHRPDERPRRCDGGGGRRGTDLAGRALLGVPILLVALGVRRWFPDARVSGRPTGRSGPVPR